MNSQGRTRQRLEEAEIATLRAKELAQELLSLSKGGAPLKQPVDLSELLRTCAHFSFQGTSIECGFDFPSDVSMVEADPGQISRAFSNLFNNAKEAMPNAGTVEVRIVNETIGKDEHPILPAGKYVIVSIKDQGAGISSKILPKIFDPYFTTKKRGSGMGLTVVYATVKRHGGVVEVESTSGKGATFRIFLPASDSLPKAKVADREASIGTHARILVMDDQDAILDVSGEMLKALGHEVGLARDGMEAVDMYKMSMIKERKYDLVIMDLTIPQGMGGKEAVVRLHEIDPSAKVIVSSGYSNDPVMSNFDEHGFVAVLHKPYSMDDLAGTIAKALSADSGR
jgi:two-component system cell cycle sensor histidine kinase/response regulator CckA